MKDQLSSRILVDKSGDVTYYHASFFYLANSVCIPTNSDAHLTKKWHANRHPDWVYDEIGKYLVNN